MSSIKAKSSTIIFDAPDKIYVPTVGADDSVSTCINQLCIDNWRAKFEAKWGVIDLEQYVLWGCIAWRANEFSTDANTQNYINSVKQYYIHKANWCSKNTCD